jgi:ABC-type amino acid transport system permease subunit
VYVSIGIFIHHLVLFTIESFSFTGFLHTMQVTLISSFFSVIICFIFELFRIKSNQEFI